MPWTDITPPTTSWSPMSGPSGSFSDPTAPSTTFFDVGGAFLVTSGGDYLVTSLGYYLVTHGLINDYNSIASPSNSWSDI